jgi:phenylalanyl-tRNA synthetase, beta subunit
VAEGLFVATALVGTPFPEAGITIAKRAMRGVDSEGMICSKGELGINEDKDTHWIWDLAQDLEVSDTDLGRPLSEVFPRLEATILEVDSKSLTNRPDLTGHF